MEIVDHTRDIQEPLASPGRRPSRRYSGDIDTVGGSAESKDDNLLNRVGSSSSSVIFKVQPATIVGKTSIGLSIEVQGWCHNDDGLEMKLGV